MTVWDNNGRPIHIEAFLVTVRNGAWFRWTDSKNKIYANLVVLDGGSKPSETDCTNGLKALQEAWDVDNADYKCSSLPVIKLRHINNCVAITFFFK